MYDKKPSKRFKKKFKPGGARPFRSQSGSSFRFQGPNRNSYIRATEVRVIGSEGENLGVMQTSEALKISIDQGLDLIEVSHGVTPPVCRIMDYSKYLYEEKRRKRKNKGAKIKSMKEFKFTPVIEKHDIDTKVKRAIEWLEKGYTVRIIMERRGRQAQTLANSVFEGLLTNFSAYSTIEPEPKREGLVTFITYKPNGKTKNQKDSTQKVSQDQPEG